VPYLEFEPVYGRQLKKICVRPGQFFAIVAMASRHWRWPRHDW